MSSAPYRPNAFYYRKTAREGTPEEMRKAILDLVEEREKLRAWIREQGLIPPLFKVPGKKALEIMRSPASAWQREISEKNRFRLLK